MRSTIISAILAIVVSLHGIATSQTHVQKLIGGPGVEDGWVVSITPDGGYLIAGQTTSVGFGEKDVFITKLGPAYDVQWTRVLGGGGEDWIDKVVGLHDSSFVFIGYTAVPGRLWDGWVFKMDLSGTLVWSKRYGGTGDDMLVDAVEESPISDGHLLVMGHTKSYGVGGWDYWLLRLDADGEPLSSRTVGGFNTDALNTFIPTSDHGYLLAAHTYSYGAGMHDVALVRLSADLNVQWMKTYGTYTDETAYVAHARQDGGYVIVGGTHAGAFGVRDAMIMTVDSLGNLLGAWSFGTGGEDQLVRGVDLGYLGVAVVGWASDSNGVLDGWYAHVSDNGTLASSVRCGGAASDRLIGAARLPSGDLMFAGQSASGDAQSADAYLVRTPLEGPELMGSVPGPSQTAPISLYVGVVTPSVTSLECEVHPGPDSVLAPAFSITDLYATQSPVRKIFIPKVFGRAGDAVTIPVMLNDPLGIAGGDLAFAFDTSIVTIHGVRRGTLTAGFSLAFNVSRPESVLVSFARATGIVQHQPGSLVVLDGTIRPDVPDSISTALTITKAVVYDAATQSMVLDVENGLLSTGFGSKGDVNADGQRNSADAILVLRCAVGLGGLDEPALWAADFDGDGAITPFDAVGVLRAAVGLTSPPPGDTVEAPVRVFISPITAAAGENVEMNVRIDGMPDLISGTLEFDIPGGLVAPQASKVRSAFAGLAEMAVVAPARVRLVFAASSAWGHSSGEVAAIELKALSALSNYVPMFVGGALTDKDGQTVSTIQFVTTGVDDRSTVRSFELHPNHPNPFNPSTTIRFDVPNRSRVQVIVRNLLGQTVDVLVDDIRAPGTYQTEWHPQVASGLYLCTMTAMDEASGAPLATFTRKLLLLK